MGLADVIKISSLMSLLVTVGILAVTIAASLLLGGGKQQQQEVTEVMP
jgi:hypothetical protein